MNETWQTVGGVVVRGHQVASQRSKHYPRGTIEMQLPLFRDRGLDLTPFYCATLNVSIAPHVLTMKNPEYTFRSVRWTSRHPPEDFSFSRCKILFEGAEYEGWIYYPHPATKRRNFQSPSTVEIIAPWIPNIKYNDQVEVRINSAEVSVGNL